MKFLATAAMWAKVVINVYHICTSTTPKGIAFIFSPPNCSLSTAKYFLRISCAAINASKSPFDLPQLLPG